MRKRTNNDRYMSTAFSRGNWSSSWSSWPCVGQFAWTIFKIAFTINDADLVGMHALKKYGRGFPSAKRFGLKISPKCVLAKCCNTELMRRLFSRNTSGGDFAFVLCTLFIMNTYFGILSLRPRSFVTPSQLFISFPSVATTLSLLHAHLWRYFATGPTKMDVSSCLTALGKTLLQGLISIGYSSKHMLEWHSLFNIGAIDRR